MEDETKEPNKAYDELNKRLREAEETLDAIRNGQVDAFIIKGPKEKQVYSLINPDHPYQVFFENMNEAAVILSKEQIILYGNNSFFELIDASSESIIGSSILDIIAECDRSYFVKILQIEKNKKSEVVIFTKKQEMRTVLVSVFSGVWNETEQVCLLFRDITQLKRAQQYVRASESISKILSEAPQLSIASQAIIELLNELLGWEVMIIWLWNKESQGFRCVDISHIQGLEIGAFKEKNRALEAKSKLLFGHASLSNRPTWKKDVTEDASFIRRTEAVENGLRGAFAFSFNQNSELGGFVELFRRTTFTDAIDNLMLDLVSSIGIGLGIYLERSFSNEKKFQFSKALELSLNSIYTVNIQGIVINWYPGAEKIYGWTAKEMVGTSINRIYPKNTSHEFDQVSKAVISGKSIENFESSRVGKEGREIWVNSCYDGIRDFFGKISELIVVEQDITAQKHCSQSVLESNKRFDSFIEITEDWIWESDARGVFLFSNLAVYSILGYQADEVLGKNLLYFVLLENRSKIESKLEEYAAKKEGWKHMIMPLLHKNGSCRWVETNSKELLGPNSELLGFRGSSRDITESKKLEKIKDEFISTISHEFRTPLTSIYGGLSLLVSKEYNSQERKELLDNAYKNSIRLMNLINDTMDFEKLQLGHLQLDLKKINLCDVILESVKLSEIIANKFNVKISIKEPLPPTEVNGDHFRLVQVMMNLLSNAIKFSPNGGTILISMVVQGDKAVVSVLDNGPGVSKNFESKLFQSFSQADSSSQRATGGAGLGLYIAKSIIERHGGLIQYKTRIDEEGAEFFFDIPLCKI